MELNMICRVCLKKGKIKSIFEAYKCEDEGSRAEADSTISCCDMLLTCASIKVTPEDGYPSHICSRCVSRLWAAYKFRRLCVSSHERLTNYIAENKQSVTDIKTEVPDDCPLIELMLRDIKQVTDNKNAVDKGFIKLEDTNNPDGEANLDFEVDKEGISYEVGKDDMNFEVNKEDLNFDDSFFDNQYDSEDENKPIIDIVKESSQKGEKTKRIKKKQKNEDETYEPNKHKRKTLSCSQCPRKFNHPIAYLKHEDRHLLDEIPVVERDSFACSTCPAKFNFKKILIKHEKYHVIRKKQTAVREETPCPHCSKVFKNKISFEKHVNNHLGITSDPEGPLACIYCPKVFKNRPGLMKHEISHFNIKTYYCETCKKSYRCEIDHKAYCGLELLFGCDHCNKSFKTKSRLINHMSTHGERKRSYKCEFEGCVKTFLSAAGLLKHKSVHSGVKIICHLCSKEFTDKYLLQSHVNRHNNIRKYPCSYCEKRFFNSGARLEHERRHTNTRNFPCTQCDKRFVSSTNLKRHMLWHEKNFSEHCRFCDKKFLVRGNRITHEAIMHGITKTVDESKYYCKERFKATRLPKVILT